MKLLHIIITGLIVIIAILATIMGATAIEERECIPRPSCLDSTPRCMIAEPISGWCNMTACPADAKLCPDGITSVGRVGPHCEFTECPGEGIIGGDRDEHGCIGSAGYRWCEEKQSCLRVWETPCKTSQEDMTKIYKSYNITQRIISKVRGLENAILHVNNTNALERLKANLERFQENHPYIYEKLNVTLIGNKTVIMAEDGHQFLFLKLTARRLIELDENGNIVSEQPNIWAYIYGRKNK